MYQDIRSSAIAFRDSFLSEASPTSVDSGYGAVLRVLLFYLWRWCSLSREAGITGAADPKASLISLSAYEATLGVVQLLRIQYQADAITLARALMERIAIVGFLGENRALIPRYFAGSLSLYKQALAWAKKKPLTNWMMLYSSLTDVTHSNIEGPAGHVHNRTAIGNAFRETPSRDPAKSTDMADELLGLVVYSLIALDPLALALIQDTRSQPFPNDGGLIQSVGLDDAKRFRDFLQVLIGRYSNFRN